MLKRPAAGADGVVIQIVNFLRRERPLLVCFPGFHELRLCGHIYISQKQLKGEKVDLGLMGSQGGHGGSMSQSLFTSQKTRNLEVE